MSESLPEVVAGSVMQAIGFRQPEHHRDWDQAVNCARHAMSADTGFQAVEAVNRGIDRTKTWGFFVGFLVGLAYAILGDIGATILRVFL